MTIKKLPISVCIIAGPEAHRIAGALKSVAAWVEDIHVVVNDTVTDGTDVVSERHGAKVYREPWKGYIGQKISADAKATQPWILALDADEVVGPELQAEIETLFASGRLEQFAGYNIPRCSFYCGRWIRHGDWYPDRVLRLYQKTKSAWVGIEPHSVIELTGPMGQLTKDLLHYSNENINRQIAKIAPYSDGFVTHWMGQGRRSTMFDLTMRPCWRFLRAYIFKGGFLDGWPGYYIAALTAFSTLTRYVKIREARLPKDNQ